MVDRVNVLGPFDVLDGGTRVRLKGPLDRAVLGYLAVRANHPVESSRLADRLLPDADPMTARRRVREAARRVAALVDGGAEHIALERRAGGSCYVLRAHSRGTDLLEMRHRAREARTALDRGAVDRALHELDAALGLWRGPLLEGIRTDGWPETAALHEEHLLLKEDQLGCQLAAGAAVPESVVDELRAMTAREPGRETLVGLLIDTLARQGRYAEAEYVYRTTAATLAERWGLDPAPELQARLEGMRAFRAGETLHPVDVALLSVFRPIDDDGAATARLCRRVTDQGGVVVWRIARVLMAVFTGAQRQDRAVDAARRIMRDRLAAGLPETRITVTSGPVDGFRPDNAATAGATGPVLWGRMLVDGLEIFVAARPGTITVNHATWQATRHRLAYRSAGEGRRELVLDDCDTTNASGAAPRAASHPPTSAGP
ncbi:BTAD domain-containing putative transcriptional regulator [Streptomyces sp. NPDC059943]|uniref:AfsR/SARP family transcriptional regulator n=1 Tax=Streptomyces sp. NPDC059943 TaxID=3347010 RepID=UPI003659451E